MIAKSNYFYTTYAKRRYLMRNLFFTLVAVTAVSGLFAEKNPDCNHESIEEAVERAEQEGTSSHHHHH